jgi:creatinine amidohydrolase
MPRHPDRQLERLAQPVAARLLAASGTAVVAVGSVEQHGGHLPLGTDAFAAQSIAERVAVLVDVCTALSQAGVTRIVLVNWHEGNSPTLRLAAAEAQQRLGLRILIAETHVITHSLYPDEMEFTHAGSMETAAVLAYEPGLVHLDRMVEVSDLASGEAAHELFRQRDVYPVLQDFHDIAPTGWYGRPERAEAGRAEEIAEAVADHVVRRVREIWSALAHRDVPVAPGGVPPEPDAGGGLSTAVAGAER